MINYPKKLWTKEKEEEDEGIFYALLQEVMDEMIYQDLMIMIDDFNVKVGKEESMQ